MSGIDAMLVVLFAVAVIDGWRRGFIVHAADLVVLAPAVWITVTYSPAVADWLVLDHDLNPMKARIISPVALFASVQVLGLGLTWLLGRQIPEEVQQARLNRATGVVPALAKWVALAGVALAMAAAIPHAATREALGASHLARPMVAAGRALAGVLGLDLDDTVGRAFRQMAGPHGGHEAVRIPAITDPGKLRVKPEQEAEMLRLVNEERKKAGVAPLAADAALTPVARAHSTDMWTRGYFAHEDPDGRDVGDRVRTAGVPFGLVGENIALAPTLDMAHTGLMNSPDHRHNILDPRFKRLGIGIVLGGSNGIMVTQNFRD